MIELGWKTWAALAAVVTVIAGALYMSGVLPWWGILVAVPVVTLAAGVGLIVLGIVMWMAGGSH